MIAQVFIPTGKLVMRTGTQSNEVNIEIETEPVAPKLNQPSTQHNFSTYKSFYTFQLLNCYILFLLKDDFLFHLFFL